MFGECLNEVRRKAPLIHNITNYVTVNDVANMLLACGGSPIMADDPADAEAITAICGGLHDGACRGDCLVADAGWRRKCDLPEPNH